jgi:uncharacterized membrane protein YhaH (DUF805 family)
MQKLFSYFSIQGRTNRQRYWLTGVGIFVAFLVSILIAGALAFIPLLGGLIFLAVLAASFVAALANGARRLHDRGKSAWWLLLFMGLPTLLSIPAELVRFSSDPGAQGAGALLTLLGLPFSIWGLVVMGFLKGTTGPNKYGDDPLQPVQEVFA